MFAPDHWHADRVLVWRDSPAPPPAGPPRVIVPRSTNPREAGIAVTTLTGPLEPGPFDVTPTGPVPCAPLDAPNAVNSDGYVRRVGRRTGPLLAKRITPERGNAEIMAAVDLSAWRARVAAQPVGAELAWILAQRPRRVAPTAFGSRTGPLWANALIDSLQARQRLIAHLQARQTADLAELSGTYPGLREFLPTEIALALRIAESTANVHLDEATDLMHRLPDTFTALDSGRITAVKAATIRLHSKDLDTEKSALLERDVLRAAPTQTVPELRDTVRRSVLRRDPTGADQRHAKEKYQRRITRHHKPDGMAGLWILSTAQDIAAIDTCATALGQASRAPDDGRTAQARAVDALTDICTHILDTGSWNTQTLPTNHRRRPHLHVTVPLDALQPNNTSDDTDHPTTTHTSSQNTNSTSGDTDHPTTTDPGTTDAGSTDNPTHTGTTTDTTTDTTGRGGYLAGYGPISRSQTLAIAVNATWRRLVCDPLTGTLLDYGRTTYTPPTALADHIIARDNTCYLPGCRQPAHLADIDHITPYQPGQPTGGHTVDTNLGAGCRHHHRAKDGGEFHLERATNGDYHWITPLGRNYTKPATPLWHPPPPEPAHRPILPIPERPQTPPPPPKPTRNPGDPPF